MADQTDEFGGTVVGSDADEFGGELLEDTRSIGPAITEDPEDASGIGNALLAGLTNSEENKVFWLAAKRFPELVEEGKNPAEFYAFDESGDLFYRDPYSGEYKKEFGDDIFGFDIDYLDNIGPAGQFLAEVVSGAKGMVTGFISTLPFAGGFPGAAYGGAKGTAIGGGAAYAFRAALSEVLGGPPLDVEQAAKDLTISSVFGAIPFGAPTKGAPSGMKWILDKFPGSDGRTVLADIVQNGGRSVDEKLEYMAQRYPDISISRAEANDLIGNAGYRAEAWLAKNARNEEMVQHFENRNTRVSYHAEKFFDDILNKFPGRASGDAELDVAKAAEDYLAAERRKLAEQTAPMYREAYDADVAIDVGDIIKQIDDVLADPNASTQRVNAYKQMRTALIDASIGENAPRTSTELLHEGLKDNFNRLLSGLTKDADIGLKREASLIRQTVSNRLKDANPVYAQVTKIYDDAFGTAQSLDRSIVGQFAKVAGYGERASRMTRKLFSGNIRPQEIEELKGILQSTDEGARAWQNLKGTWLSTQWDDVLISERNPLSVPNKFLRAMGIPSPSRAFPRQQNVVYDATGMRLPASSDELARLSGEVAEYQASGKKAQMWEAIFEPDELASFIDLTNMMQMVGRIQTLGGSDSFENFMMNALISQESKQVLGQGLARGGQQAAAQTGGLIAGIMNLVPRITSKGFGDAMTGVRQRQKDAYTDLLISHIVDPIKRVSLDNVLEAASPISYLVSQTFSRGGVEGLNNLFNSLSPAERQQQFIERGDEVIQEQQQEQQPELNGQIESASPTASNLPLFEDIQPGGSFGPMAGGFDPSMSPTILPSASDREIAMRRNAQRSGIGSLV